MKADGHTHTEYCRHGSGEATELFIQKAIELGFQSYSLTEHPPLPPDFKASLPYTPVYVENIAMKESEMDSYIRDMLRLKEKYKDKIQLKVGLEVDFLPEHTGWTRGLLREYGPHLDDSLISLHFLKGNKGYRCIDLNPEDFKEGLLNFYGSFEKVVEAYFDELERMVLADFGPYKPKRIGHFNLYRKFQYAFYPHGYITSQQDELKIENLLSHIKEKGYSLDYNAAGLFKPLCREPYLTVSMVKRCTQLKIPMVYGSDSHSVGDVGRGYKIFEKVKGIC